MAEIKPLRMLNVYLVSPDALNPRARGALPGYVSDIRGPVNAYSPDQAFAKLIGGLGLPDSEQPYRILDELNACAFDEHSDFFSPGFVKVMREIYPLKRSIAAWLVRHYMENELGSFRGSKQEKAEKTREFMVKHRIYDRNSRTITVPGSPTKDFLKKGLRRVLNAKRKNELISEYEAIIRPDLAGEAGDLAGKKPQVQGMLF